MDPFVRAFYGRRKCPFHAGFCVRILPTLFPCLLILMRGCFASPVARRGWQIVALLISALGLLLAARPMRCDLDKASSAACGSCCVDFVAPRRSYCLRGKKF